MFFVMFPFPAAAAARLALLLRLTLRLRRVLHTRRVLRVSAARARGRTAALDPRFPVDARRAGVNGALSLRAVLDPRFPVGARRAGVNGALSLRTALDSGFPVAATSGGGCTLLPEYSGPRCRGNPRHALIHRRQLRAVRSGRLFMPRLNRRPRQVPVVLGETLRRSRLGDDSTRAAVEAHARRCCIRNDWLVINIADIGNVDDIQRGVVAEYAVAPVPAVIADAEVAEAIVDAAVEAHARPPIARIPDIQAIVPAPVARCP